MSGVKYFTQWQWPELMWRVDPELALVEVAKADHAAYLECWVLSHYDLAHVDILLDRKDMEEVRCPE